MKSYHVGQSVDVDMHNSFLEPLHRYDAVHSDGLGDRSIDFDTSKSTAYYDRSIASEMLPASIMLESPLIDDVQLREN